MLEEALKNPELIENIERALKEGNTVELKREKDNLVLVEIKRKVKIKIPTNG